MLFSISTFVKYYAPAATVWLAFLFFSCQAVAQDAPNTRLEDRVENCFNGEDDDGDGLIDCKDVLNCSGLCNQERSNFSNSCSDGYDNDGDGDVDCADSDCDCDQPEICNNYADDDGDGKIDCQDDDCFGKFVGCENNCENGVDDDGDGFFDYYDGDCVEQPGNPNNYIVVKPDCEARPDNDPFDAREAWRSDRRTANNRGLPVVADVDSDSIPEVISISDNKVFVLNGRDGTTEHQYNYPNNKGNDYYEPLAVADVDNDGYGEIFHINNNGWIRGMDFDPTSGITLRWIQKSSQRFRFPGLADFNGDGKTELYYGNEIRDALTGDIIVEGSHTNSVYPSGNNWENELNALPVAVDILPNSECAQCGGLELVLGHIIYAVDLASGTLTEAKVMDDVPDSNKTGFTGDYYPKESFGTSGSFGRQSSSTTAVVDYNQDGFLDVIMSGAINRHNGPSAVFLWDLQNNSAKAFTVSRPGSTIPDKIPRPNGGTKDFRTLYRDLNNNKCDESDDCTWIRGIGSLNVANIDTDPQLECTFMSGSSLYAIDNQMALEWVNHSDFWESTSGITGTAVFDFDGDGASEVIYRDQVDLYIVDGENGQILNSQYANLTKCSSNTAYEYPVIADVDGDGETEILVTCASLENEKYEDATTNGGTDGHVRAYKASEGTFWVPARSIWNQFAYFNVNVNDNMTIPSYQQPHHLNFSQTCVDENAPSKFSLNKFLNQSPRITFCGDLAFPSPRLDFGDGVSVTAPVCPQDSFEVQLSFENTGDYPVYQPIPFAFYAQDPAQSYGDGVANPWLDTLSFRVPGGLAKGQRVDTTVMIRGARGQFSLFVSLNDIGPFDRGTNNPLSNSEFYPLTELNGTVRECDATPTIVSELVDPVPFQLNATAFDNRRCGDGPGIINNGQITITDENGDPLTPLSNYEFALTNTRTGEAVDISSSVTNIADSATFILRLDSGTYELDVRYRNAAFSCGGVTQTLTINRIESWPEDLDLTIVKDQDVSSCKPGTADGQARVLIDGAVPEDHYRIEWRNEERPDDIFVGHTVTNLRAITYKIFVTNTQTGCELNDSTLRMDLPRPLLDDPVVTPVTDCKVPANGTVTARMQSGDIADYEFILISKNAGQDTLKSADGRFTELAAGLYELKAIDPTNDCGLYSDGRDVEIKDEAASPQVTLSQVNPQTACDPTQANGHLRATPADQSSTYSYTWYKGTVTTGSEAEEVSDGTADATGLYTYGNPTQTFTVVIVNTDTECSVTESFDLQEMITVPEIDPADVSVKPLTSCESPNGQLRATVAGDTVGYDFRIYQGTNASGTALAEETTGIFTGLEAVTYTVVAEERATGCFSTGAAYTETVTIPDGTVDPATVLTVTPVNQSSCDSNNPNGQISATINGGDVSDYRFEWKKNVGGVLTDIETAEPTAVVDDNQVSSIRKGNYQVTITADSSGCSTTQNIILDDDIISGDDILLDLTSVAATKCRPPDGSISIAQVSYTRDGGSTYTTDNLSNYSFRWYEGADTTYRVDESLNASAVTANLVNVPPGQYTVVATNLASTCASVAYTGTVDGPDPLQLSFTATTHGSTGQADPCINPDGSLTVNIDAGGSGSYAYQWYKGEGTSTPISGATTASLNGIRADRYTVEVTDLSTNCITDSTFVLGANDNLLPAPASALKDYAPSTSCDPSAYNGILEAEVDPSIRTASYVGHADSDFFYYWFEGDRVVYKDPLANASNLDDPANYDVFQGVIPTAADNRARLENLAAGEYTVVVLDVKDYLAGGSTDITLIGCRAIDTTFVVEAIAQGPQVADPIVVDNTSCAGNGSIQVTANKKNTDTTPLASPEGYSFEWSADDGTPLTATSNGTGTTSTLSGLAAGNYTVRIEDNTTKCDTTLTVEVIDDYVIEEIDNIVASGVTTCNGADGRLEVTAMTNSDPLSNYTFRWYSENYNASLSPDDPANTALEITDATPNNADLINQPVGTYWVVAQHNTTQCYSIPQQRVIADETPEINILAWTDKDSFVECTGINEGQFERVSAQGSSGVYDFYWYTGREEDLTAASVPFTSALSATETTVSGLAAGYYAVVVQDAGGSGPACDATATFLIETRTATPILDAVKLNDQTICDPDGSIQVTNITLDGNTVDSTQYEITWYKGSVDQAGSDAFKNSQYERHATLANTYVNLEAGIYFIQAEAEFANGCLTNVQQIIINDESEPLIVTGEVDNAPILACDPSQFAEGEIEIEILNSNRYTVTWYRGGQVDVNQRFENYSGLDPAQPESLKELPPGIYTVQVVDDVTQCSAVRRYTVEGISVPLAAFPSSLPQTSCLVDNGAVGVTINGGRSDYTVAWFAGTDTSGEPINSNGQYFVEGLPHGVYTVQVTENEDLSCEVVTKQVTVRDGRTNDLEITVASDFPTTNCDDSNPNGQLSATIADPRDLFQYEFFWYEGTNTSTNPVAFGPTVTNLGENSYTVIARDRGTGCLSNPATGNIITLLDSGLLPAPTVVMVSPLTRCTEPDGVARAILDATLTVDPNVDYEYIWTNAQDEVVFSSSRTNEATQLDTGTYSVVVRNVISGCLSAPGQVYVSDSIYIPEFEITTTPSFCNEPSGTLKIDYYEAFPITNIEWTTPYGFANGDFLDQQPAGNYTATITLGNGCQITREAYVVPGIQIYNTVSPNGDQKNDIFTISCIGDFKNNIVRIFNRAGSLVYQQMGYDNQVRYFNGYGNQGLYLGGKELPDGTYFYIVDKRNGDEPESGYLELLR